MPGVSLVQGDLQRHRDAVGAAFDAVRFLDTYDVTRTVATDRTVLGYTGYESYPVRRIETAEADVLLEGYLYDCADTEAAVRTAVRHLARGETAPLEEWLLARDGDFLLVVDWADSPEVTVLNDTFGRLPTYYAVVDGTAVLSRELDFVRTFARAVDAPLELDRLTAAHQLVFGYTIGERTTFREVRTVPPGARVTVGDGRVEVDRYHQYDFGTKAHREKSVEENAAALATRFADACRRRVRPDSTPVVSLSGGLDSRAVAGMFSHLDVPFRTATFDTEHEAYADDVRVARTIADALSVDWSLYRAESDDAHDERLLEMLQGMNYLAMSFILDFFEQLRADVPDATYVTGDGGDKIFVDLSAPVDPASDDALVEYILDSNSKIPVDQAAAVTGVDEARIRQSLAERLRSYPEDSRSQQYAHFLFRERGLNFLNHGEDRNRYYFWSVTPFYSRPVFDYAMNCPDGQKHQRRLYRAFLEQFAPGLLDIEYPNFGSPITSLEYRLKKRSYALAARYPSLRETLVRWLKVDHDRNDTIVADIERRLARADVDPLSSSAIADVLDHSDSLRSQALYAVLTVTALAGDVQRDSTASAPEASHQ